MENVSNFPSMAIIIQTLRKKSNPFSLDQFKRSEID